MYLWSQEQAMPLGPGLQWTKSGNGFRKNVLQQQTSFYAVQWLQWEQTKINVQIQHAYHQGEVEVYDCMVDGYAVINGVETVWEYNGCIYHGCPCIQNPTDEQVAKQLKWIERKAKLESRGCKVIEMSCCRWRPLLAQLKKNPPKTELGRVLCFDDQEILHFICYIAYVTFYKCKICKTFKDDIVESN